MSHEDYMREAIAIAQQAVKFPAGAVIIRRHTGEILAKGFNRSAENFDPFSPESRLAANRNPGRRGGSSYPISANQSDRRYSGVRVQCPV
jgi:hypothetical protein